MENNSVSKDHNIKIPIIENDSEEEEKKNRAKFLRAAKRTNRTLIRSLPVVEKMDYECLASISKGYRANSSVEKVSLSQNESDIKEFSKISAYRYILNFIVFCEMKGKKNFSLPRLIHATESALIVSDEQVDIDVKRQKNRWVSDKMDAAVKQLLAENKLSKTILNHNEYITTISALQCKGIRQDWTELEKILASNLYIVYNSIQSGKQPNLSQLKDTVYPEPLV